MRLPVLTVLFCVFAANAPALAAALDVAVDHARILKIPRAAESVIIGNPAIVDVTVHDAQTLVLTGRSYGVTNVVVLDAEGQVVFDDSVTVSSVEDYSVRIYRQAARTTYSCNPKCEPRVTIGDEGESFANAVSQFSQHESMAKSAE